ncbi:dihydrolipoyl dehydrogenase family protein [Pararhodobacter oceanensis]|uniref:Dihydrolipoamide dehydrogenase n=1 Tax=Pararhodobacter oceanensis TaxID=2172121 RepID=A0A2T8HVL8_9RHOB|nr:FAD-dependent oxidoreductase [Pararhodobacter oceanensis]PVH29497.1 dihydrolipoamide dehydrogenase [Pararhodobacter oceanensis]
MDLIKTDICVIGAGSGGLSVAAGAVQMGASVVLIEGHKMGGDCLNYGCVPSKALLAAGKAAAQHRRGAALGITPDEPVISYGAAQEHVAQVIAAIEPHDSQERFEGLGVQVIRDWARFTGKDEVEAGGKRIRARRFVIATGSRPLVPPITGLADVPHLTNETIFDLRAAPEHLLIIGGGPIGLEMAQAHRRLGCKVTVIEGAKALGNDDPEAAALVVAALRGEGIEIIEGAQVEAVRGEAGAIEVKVAGGQVLTGSHLLVAVGRTPNTDRLNLEAAGVTHGRGGVEVNESLRTSNRKVYAIGDIAGRGQFTHVAGYQAGVIIRSMLFALPSKARRDHIPHVTYCDPELAQVGLTEAAAKQAHGDGVQVIKLGFDAADRAQAEGKTRGFIKVMVLKGRPIGATIVGPNAGEMIGIWAMALANKMKIGAIASMVLPYPTMGELSKRVAGAYFSPKLFESSLVKRVVGVVQSLVP